MECKYCASKAIKNGKQSNSIQCWLCTSCKRSFQEAYIYKGKDLEVKAPVLLCHRSGCGFRATQRITGVAVSG